MRKRDWLLLAAAFFAAYTVMFVIGKELALWLGLPA